MSLPSAGPAPAALLALAEYDIGELVSITTLQAGSSAARKVITSRGSYLLKPAYRARDVELQARIAPLLTARGLRQPLVIATSAGGAVTSSGFLLLEFLPGAITTDPTPAQTAAAMRHISLFHAVLGELAFSYQPDPGSLWSRSADPDFLLAELPGLLARRQLSDADTDRALAVLAGSMAGLGALPRQVVHGDIGPDNVLMNGNEVVSLIDFTPYWDSVLFAACSALYWYHVYGRDHVPAERLRSSAAAIGEQRPWTDAELTLWPAGLVREALRRLMIPLALADQPVAVPVPVDTSPADTSPADTSPADTSPADTSPAPQVGPRLAALRAIVRILPELASAR